MGRKRAGQMSKTDAVKAAIADGKDKPKDGSAYIKEKFGLDVTPQAFSTMKSVANKKAAKAPGRRGGKPGGAAAVPKPSTNGAPGLALSVEAIKTLVEDLGVEQVISIARLFGK